jgi:hypothetical protein
VCGRIASSVHLSPSHADQHCEAHCPACAELAALDGSDQTTERFLFVGSLTAHQQRPREQAKNHPIWESVEQLEWQSLLSFVPHLLEGDPASSQAEVIHPFGGEPEEVEIGRAAHEAGLALLPDFKRQKATSERWRLAPIERAIPDVQMVGVARLRYRPHTRKTSVWHRNLAEVSEQWVIRYRELRQKVNAPKPIAQNQ